MILVSYLISSNSIAQIRLDSNDRVNMPKSVYKAFRASYYTKDTIIFNQKEIIAYKDSIMKLDELKLISLKEEILQKNITIDTLSTEYNKLFKEHTKEKSSIISNYKFWLGITGGLIFGVLITN